MNVALTPASFAIVSIVFLTVGALVAQLTIRLVAGFKPHYIETFSAGAIGNAVTYLLGTLLIRIFTQLRLNLTLSLICLMIAVQVAMQAIAYVLITRERDGRRLRFWQGCVVTVCVSAFGAAVTLIWSRLRIG